MFSFGRTSRSPTCHCRQHCQLIVTILTIASLCTFPTDRQISLADESEPAAGRAFSDALNKPIGLSWQDQELRTGLRRLASVGNIAIVIDRRIDPSQTLTLRLPSTPLRDVLKQIAAECDCGISVLDGCVFIGPVPTASRLRTVIEQKSQELAAASGTAASRVAELTARHIFNWNDLTSPQELLGQIAARYGVTLPETDAVPHDLWAAASSGSVTASEAFLLVLSQFDLSFEWIRSSAGQPIDGLKIVSMPESPRVERRFNVKRAPDAKFVAELKQEHSGVSVSTRGRIVTASGTAEQLDEIEAALFPGRPSPLASDGTGSRKTGPKTTTYTFTVKAPLDDFLKALEQQSGFKFEFDADELKTAGVNLDAIVDLRMNKATAEDLFEGLFKDTGINWKLDGSNVRLTPSSR
jgi:hypothetical protein